VRAQSSYNLVTYGLDVEAKGHQTAQWNELISSKTPWRVGVGEGRVSAALPVLGSEVPIYPQESEFLAANF